MSLVSSLAGGVAVCGFPPISPLTVSHPAPQKGDIGYTIFTVNPLLQRSERTRTLTEKAKLSGIKKKGKVDCARPKSVLNRLQCIPHMEAVGLLMCNVQEEAALFNTTLENYLNVDLSDLPDDIETLDGVLSNLNDDDIKDLQTSCESIKL